MLQDAGPEPVVIDLDGLNALFEALRRAGYRVVGPTVRDGAIMLDELSSPADLPVGVGDRQDGGSYRLRRREDDAAFGFANGPQSWRRFLAPPRELLWRAGRSAEGFTVEDAGGDAGHDPERYAFVGVRACDLRAIEVQDLVFDRGPVPDPRYASRRTDALIIAVNCTEPGGTCFCASMGTGPRAAGGFDLALTEVLEGEHRFVVEIGSDAGAELMASAPRRPAHPGEIEGAAALVDAAAGRMGRTMGVEGLPELLAATLEHPRWDSVAERCLACGNCTLVCPTCFCSTVEDSTDLAGEHAERWRRWDSCFTGDFSFIHGGSARPSIRSRYRQWLTHKLGTWHDQFGTSGCVGCGRCIAWCPVGIDLTEEIAGLRGPATGTGGVTSP
ncbi:MAG TPA: 4Fe-4S dicluster domain-containing protein [Acidimicrobiales bacterium]|nr:4Fe-4S dicluster domain-containing protein [Acidimicrobiales bacterium]